MVVCAEPWARANTSGQSRGCSFFFTRVTSVNSALVSNVLGSLYQFTPVKPYFELVLKNFDDLICPTGEELPKVSVRGGRVAHDTQHLTCDT